MAKKPKYPLLDWKMMYGEIPFTIQTDPPEAITHRTHRLKKSEIKILQKMDRTAAADIRQEIFDDIIASEKCD